MLRNPRYHPYSQGKTCAPLPGTAYPLPITGEAAPPYHIALQAACSGGNFRAAPHKPALSHDRLSLKGGSCAYFPPSLHFHM